MLVSSTITLIAITYIYLYSDIIYRDANYD